MACSVSHHVTERGNTDHRVPKNVNPPAIDVYAVAGGLGDILLSGGMAFAAIMQIGIGQPESAGIAADQSAHIDHRPGRIQHHGPSHQLIQFFGHNLTLALAPACTVAGMVLL